MQLLRDTRSCTMKSCCRLLCKWITYRSQNDI